MVSGSQRLSSKGIYFFVNYIYNFNVFTGFSVKTPNGGNHTVKARLLMCSVDLPGHWC